MQYIKEEPGVDRVQTHTILCCECGTPIEPNPTNMCVACLRTHVDITEDIPKQGQIFWCRFCERYMQTPTSWVVAPLESKELLTICLKKVKGLSKVRLIDAGFIWTEPHSKRIKVKLVIQKEVQQGAYLEQSFVVEFVVGHQMCTECQRVEAKNYWRARCQIRQKVSHMKTLLYLEQMILKYNAHKNTTNIKVMKNGMDFYYGSKQDAKRMLDFLVAALPVKYTEAVELVSHDVKSNTYENKISFCIEIVPICVDSVVCISPKLARNVGNVGQILVCLKIGKVVNLIDPYTLAYTNVNAETYWRNNFQQLRGPKQLTEFIVMDVEMTKEKDLPHVLGMAHKSYKHTLVDVWVVRAEEYGLTENYMHCRSHLGNRLKIGNSVMGVDFTTININNPEFNDLDPSKIPDVVLVKKVRGERALRMKKRKWKLKHLPDSDAIKKERDYEDFLQELEENADVREHVNIYKDPAKLAVETDDTAGMTDDDDVPRISLQEMLEDLTLDDAPMPAAAEEVEGEEMAE